MLSTRPREQARFASLLAAVVFTGCGLAGSQHQATGTTAPAAKPVPVRVTNQNLSDANIYVLGRGQSMWLGLVTSKQTTTFPLPESFVSHGPIRLRIAPVGGGGVAGGHFDSDPVLVSQGDALHLTIAPFDLDVSVLSVEPAQSDSSES